jgi:hypothetical protein
MAGDYQSIFRPEGNVEAVELLKRLAFSTVQILQPING